MKWRFIIVYLLFSIQVYCHTADFKMDHKFHIKVHLVNKKTYTILKIHVKNNSDDTLFCTPFYKEVKWAKSHGLDCDTIDYATYLITCNDCYSWFKKGLYMHGGRCQIDMDILIPHRSDKMILYYNGKPSKILVFRIFSKSAGRGIKLYIPMTYGSNKQKKLFELLDIKSFDE